MHALLLADVAAEPTGSVAGNLLAWGLGLALVVLMVLALRKVMRRGQPEVKPPPAQLQGQTQVPPALEPPRKEEPPRVSLPPSELEAQKKAEAEQLRRQADEARAKIAELEAQR
ncbi:MAG: hypothetical protein ACOZQL_27325, partial [Myxococcota bacterium]